MSLSQNLCGVEECLTPLDLVNRYQCTSCDHFYCMNHRHDFSHDCSFLLKPKTNSLSPPKKKIKHCKKKTCLVQLDLVNRYKCTYCHKWYCLNHRHDFSHDCPNMSQPNKTEWKKVQKLIANERAFNRTVKELNQNSKAIKVS